MSGIDKPARKDKLIMLDWDGVLRTGLLVVDWAEYLADRKAFSQGTAKAMSRQLASYRNREVSYAEITESIPALYGIGLKGYPAKGHMRLAADYVQSEDFLSAFTPLAATLLAFAEKDPCIFSIIISGAPAAVLNEFAALAPVDEVWAVNVEVADDVFTGIVLDNPATLTRKMELVNNYFARGHIVLAAGDSESDQPMLTAASHRIVIGRALADEWHGDPNTLTLPSGDLGKEEIARVKSFLAGVDDGCRG